MSTKRMSENDSVLLLERNLNHLKRQFIDLDIKLKTDTRASTFNTVRQLTENRSCLTELNTKLFIEKENLEKKAVKTMCKNAKLEDQVSDFKVQNSVLNRQLDVELAMNQHILSQHLEMKQSLLQTENKNSMLVRKLGNLKEEVKIIEQVEVRKTQKCISLKDELYKIQQKNVGISEQIEMLEKDNYICQLQISQQERDKIELKEENKLLERSVQEKHKVVFNLEQRNELLEKQLATSRKNNEFLERQAMIADGEKGELLSDLSKTYKQESELLGEIAMLKNTIGLLESKNNKCIDQLWRYSR